jgi:hypothetical protein
MCDNLTIIPIELILFWVLLLDIFKRVIYMDKYLLLKSSKMVAATAV